MYTRRRFLYILSLLPAALLSHPALAATDIAQRIRAFQRNAFQNIAFQTKPRKRR